MDPDDNDAVVPAPAPAPDTRYRALMPRGPAVFRLIACGYTGCPPHTQPGYCDGCKRATILRPNRQDRRRRDKAKKKR